MVSDWIEKLILLGGEIGYLGVFVAAVGLAPSEVIIAMTAASMPSHLCEVAAAAGIGEAVGAIPMYLIGYFFSKENILKFLNGKGKFLNISEDTYNNEHKSINRYGSLYIIFSRFIPGIRIVSSLVAGFAKQNFINFFISVFIGSFAYAYIFAEIGLEVEFNMDKIKKITDTSYGIAVIIVVVFVILILKYQKKIKEYKEKKKVS